MDYVERRMAQEALNSKHGADQISSTGVVTPLNVVLFSLVLYTLYTILRPTPKHIFPKESAATVFRVYTPRTLLHYNGVDGKPVYMAVRGRVFDVSNGRNFYGPGGPYENFAGRDASRGLALHSFDAEVLTKDLDGPLDTLEGLDADELDALRGWEERFEAKYLVVGRLVSEDDYAKEKGKA